MESVNLSVPRVAKIEASWTLSALSRWTTTVSAAHSANAEPDSVVTEKAKIAGSADTEATDEAVKPTGPDSPSAVTIATPAG
jgi:hypothetical protein